MCAFGPLELVALKQKKNSACDFHLARTNYSSLVGMESAVRLRAAERRRRGGKRAEGEGRRGEGEREDERKFKGT